MALTKQEKKWQQYNVSPPDKTVYDLTPAEAKDELCKAMDLVNDMMYEAQIIVDKAEEAGY